MPFSRALGDGLFELRLSLGPTARRITYRFTTDNRIILLTTFRKQRNNERAEIARARKIADECARLNP
jgi:putative component of toxin-antitoxin plasmid stabilization module